MPKRIIVIGIIFLFIFSLLTPAYADDAVKKLGRGISNVLTFPFEMVIQVSRVNNTDGPMAAMTWGILKGLGMTVVRGGVGVYEVVSFPFPIPADYKPILTDPEFVLENLNW